MNNKEHLESEIREVKDQLNHPESLGTKTSVYTRITGYYRCSSDFNPGKQNEYRDRKSFKI